MRILCVGLSSYDITYPIDSFLIENQKRRVNERVECGGGPANNAAYLLGKWDQEVYYAGCVGNDLYGKKIKEELESVNVNTEYMETKKDITTVTSTIIANTSIGTRTIITYCKENSILEDIELDFKPDAILIDGHEEIVSNYLLDKYKDAITIIDASRAKESIINLAKKVKYLVCSKDFAETISNMKFNFNDSTSIVNIYQKLKQEFSNNIIVTLESKGALYESNGKIRIMPSLSVKAVDSTGAGDFFHGAFIYAIANGFDIENAIKLSNITGALSVTKVGSKISAPDLEEVMKIYEGN